MVDLKKADPAEWGRIVTCFSDHNYEQSTDYALAMAKKASAKADFYIARDGGSAIGAACVRVKTVPLMRRGIAYVSGGPLGYAREGDRFGQRYELVLGAIKRELVDRQGYYLIIRPPLMPPPAMEFQDIFSKLGFRRTRRARSYRTILVKLFSDVEEQRARLASKWRTDLRFAERGNIDVEVGEGERYCARFLELFGQMHRAKGFDVQVDPRIFLSLPAGSSGRVVLIAKKDGQDVAGHVLSVLGDTAVYLFGATNDLGRALKAGYILNWHSMLLAIKGGQSWYDLGGVDPDANLGVYRFKKRMGGVELRAAGPFEAAPAGVGSALVAGMLALRKRLRSR